MWRLLFTVISILSAQNTHSAQYYGMEAAGIGYVVHSEAHNTGRQYGIPDGVFVQ